MSSPFVVLIIEDDQPTLSLLAAVAKRESFEVLLASDGAQALAILHHQQVDAIVLDLLLPEISGLDILRYFKQKLPALLMRTIVITAAAEQIYKNSEELRLVRRCFRKPLDVVDLVSALHACRATKARDEGEAAPRGIACPTPKHAN
jgi:two-component system cell cycle sensor histidine kinase/response regulator CckA